MNQLSDDHLNRLLQDWAANRSTSPEDLITLQQQLQKRLSADLFPPKQTKSKVSSLTRSNRRFAAVLLALAATFLIALVGWRGFLRPGEPSDEFVDVVDQPTIPVAPALADHIHLLAEYQEVFGSDFAWLVEQSSRAEVGLRAWDSYHPPVLREYVVIRLMLFSRPNSQSDWKEVQTLNVVARSEEFVEVFSGMEKDPSLTMWAYPLDDEMISIDVRYDPSKFAGNAAVPGGLTVESSTVQPVGKQASIHSFERDGVEYRLYQSADMIAGKEVG